MEPMDAPPWLNAVKAMTFDVFGTVVDWRGSIIEALRRFGQAKHLDADWAAFADDWRLGYQPAMERVRNRSRPWVKLDDLHREMLAEILPKHGLPELSEGEREWLVRAWYQLNPWGDAVGGLCRLRRRFTLATLSNANVSMLIAMARHGGLPWDCVLSAELARTYKPRQEVYHVAVELLAAQPAEIMMVAAHDDDLRAAKSLGFRTAYIHRPRELFPGNPVNLPPEGFFDFSAQDLHDLADQLAC